ncbi:ribonuclease J [Propionispora sp. 2/2-37]|uniref:ribonuclease J n=1 Tax=Propionispora sp. 2/2-37 TaxID=1677858 RepID=UPI0006BB8455|nr:ribonuclease J [Propionispora sp. 2/2-37]
MTKIPPKLQIIPLGGLGESGKNMMVIRYGDDIIVIDSGLMFPGEDMPGIDSVIPDISYLIDNQDLVRAIILTHGHEAHIGALPYVLRKLDVPVYGTRMTLGILAGRLKKNKLIHSTLVPVEPGDQRQIGLFQVGFIRVSHSIADNVAVSVGTPAGTIVYTGDFKLDQTPVDGKVTDFYRFADLGDQGVLVLLSDSTNAEKPGYTRSEKTVGRTFDEIFRMARARIIIATFASHIHRIQQVFDVACKYQRKVALLGYNMVEVVKVALELGYLNVPDGVLIEMDEIGDYPVSGIVILTVGSQADPLAALSQRMMPDHRKMDVIPGDTIVISTAPIPGNEKLLARTIDSLLRQGADVVYGTISKVDVSGHASQEELKLMHNLIRPKFFVPVHGEYRHLKRHAQLAEEVGMPKQNIFIVENGQVLEFSQDSAAIAGKITSGDILIDGFGIGDVGNIVLRDRKQLSQDGILIVVITMDKQSETVVSGPDIVSRGFVYVRESEQLMEEAKGKVKQALEIFEKSHITEWASIKNTVRDILGKYLYERTRRRPVILPIIMEV